MEQDLSSICIRCGLQYNYQSSDGVCSVCKDCCVICGAEGRFCQNPDLTVLPSYVEIFNEIMRYHRECSDELWWFSRLDALNIRKQNEYDTQLLCACKLWCGMHAPKNSEVLMPDPSSLFQPGNLYCEFPGCNQKATYES